MTPSLEERAFQAYFSIVGENSFAFTQLSDKARAAWQAVVNIIRVSIEQEEKGPMIQLISQNGDRDPLQAPVGFDPSFDMDVVALEFEIKYQETCNAESAYKHNQQFLAFLINEKGFKHLGINDIDHPLD